MGTSMTLDTDDLALARHVVSAALDASTTLFDSSPMYGKAERTLGAALEGRRSEAIVATKVWTEDDEVAESQIAAAMSFYGGHIELLQIHNMVRWPERLRRIEELRDSGQVRLVGATHWVDSRHIEVKQGHRERGRRRCHATRSGAPSADQPTGRRLKSGEPGVASCVLAGVIGIEVDEDALDLPIADLEHIAPPAGPGFG